MQLLLALSVASLAGLSMACDAYTCGLPTATGTVSSKAVIEVATGEVFDGGWKNYDRGSGACSGLSEGYWEDAVFYLHEGAPLQNVIIGANQAEDIHCTGYCTLKFVWRMLSLLHTNALYALYKNGEAGDYTNIIGGGAYYAEDKITQHNGCGTVNVRASFVLPTSRPHGSLQDYQLLCQWTRPPSLTPARLGTATQMRWPSPY
ncbi:polysaccharide lyase family 3 protein [Armillaria borealis]|uniref:Pectate lyase n=1 Tax=Armillaria borealis TaxID=47425 RepID=A0AA39JP06_9AGAR|nr:polysaccharide lyase family 3 protein [Armillaria borealis]